jgi:hypothetical protein
MLVDGWCSISVQVAAKYPCSFDDVQTREGKGLRIPDLLQALLVKEVAAHRHGWPVLWARRAP